MLFGLLVAYGIESMPTLGAPVPHVAALFWQTSTGVIS
jgi:hypothetical protein